MLGNNVIAVDQAALRLTDVDKGLKFFNDMLGFKVNFSLQYDGFRVVMLKSGKIAIEMWEGRASDEAFELIKDDKTVDNVEIMVKNLNMVLSQVIKHGYEVVDFTFGPACGIKGAVVLGPDNIRVQFIERNKLKQLSEKLAEKVRFRYN